MQLLSCESCSWRYILLAEHNYLLKKNHVVIEHDIWLPSMLFQAPPRAEVVKSLKNGIVLNVLGMGAAILGMQATVGLLVAKALTSSAVPYYQGIPPGQSPVLALDVFLVQVYAFFSVKDFLFKFFFLSSVIQIQELLKLFIIVSSFCAFQSQRCTCILSNTLKFKVTLNCQMLYLWSNVSKLSILFLVTLWSLGMGQICPCICWLYWWKQEKFQICPFS